MTMTAMACPESYSKGLEALRNGHFYLARACFEQAVSQTREAIHSSYLAFCVIMTGGEPGEALMLALEAVAEEPENAACYLNLGRVYLAAGERKQAIETFRKGLQYQVLPEIVAELDRLGTRKPAIFPTLPRGHFLNRGVGKLLARLGLR